VYVRKVRRPDERDYAYAGAIFYGLTGINAASWPDQPVLSQPISIIVLMQSSGRYERHFSIVSAGGLLPAPT
jgi:hypothetical protein